MRMYVDDAGRYPFSACVNDSCASGIQARADRDDSALAEQNIGVVQSLATTGQNYRTGEQCLLAAHCRVTAFKRGFAVAAGISFTALQQQGKRYKRGNLACHVVFSIKVRMNNNRGIDTLLVENSKNRDWKSDLA